LTDPRILHPIPVPRIRSVIVPVIIPVIALVILTTLLPGPAVAQTTPGVDRATAADAGGVLDDVVLQIKGSFAAVGTRLSDIARAALFTLVVIDFILRAGRALIGNDPIESLIRGFVFQIGFVALASAFILFVPEFVDFLARTAIRIAGAAGSPDVSASNLVGDGLRRATNWLGEISIRRPGTVFYIVAAAISVIVLAVTVAMLVVIWAELYLCALAGLIALMFAGLTETRDIALGYVNALVGKAFKLMGLLIIVAATGEMTSGLARMDGSGFGAAMGMILMQIVGAILILTLPGALEGLIGNKFASKASDMGGKMAMTTGAAATAGTVAGGATGVSRAARQGVEAAKAGGGPMDIARASLQGLRTGATDGALDGGGTVARGETLRSIGNQIRDRLGTPKR